MILNVFKRSKNYMLIIWQSILIYTRWTFQSHTKYNGNPLIVSIVCLSPLYQKHYDLPNGVYVRTVEGLLALVLSLRRRSVVVRYQKSSTMAKLVAERLNVRSETELFDACSSFLSDLVWIETANRSRIFKFERNQSSDRRSDHRSTWRCCHAVIESSKSIDEPKQERQNIDVENDFISSGIIKQWFMNWSA